MPGFFNNLADDLEKAMAEIARMRFDVNSITVLSTAVLARTRSGGELRLQAETLSAVMLQIVEAARQDMGISIANRERLEKAGNALKELLRKIEREELSVRPDYNVIIK